MIFREFREWCREQWKVSGEFPTTRSVYVACKTDVRLDGFACRSEKFDLAAALSKVQEIILAQEVSPPADQVLRTMAESFCTGTNDPCQYGKEFKVWLAEQKGLAGAIAESFSVGRMANVVWITGVSGSGKGLFLNDPIVELFKRRAYEVGGKNDAFNLSDYSDDTAAWMLNEWDPVKTMSFYGSTGGREETRAQEANKAFLLHLEGKGLKFRKPGGSLMQTHDRAPMFATSKEEYCFPAGNPLSAMNPDFARRVRYWRCGRPYAPPGQMRVCARCWAGVVLQASEGEGEGGS